MKIKFDKKEFLETMLFGIAGLIAFTIVALITYAIGVAFDIRSLRLGFVSEVVLIRSFPLFFIVVTLVKILIGGGLIDAIAKFIGKILGIRIVFEKRKS